MGRLMSMTLSEKIIAQACGRSNVNSGDIVTCKVDLAMMHDSSGPRMAGKMLDELGVPVWDVDKLVVITDHYINDENPDHKRIQEHAWAWCKSHKVKYFIREQGICHTVLPEYGHLKPGMFCVGGDSHSTTGGAFGAFMIGIGSSDLVGVLATGEIWVRVPESVCVKLKGTLQPGIAAKDIMLKLCSKYGMMGFNYQAIEYRGPVVEKMSVEERMTLTNMAAELGAKTGLVAPDDITKAYLSNVGITAVDAKRWQSDDEADFTKTITLNCSNLVPHVAAPSSPENSSSISDFSHIKLNQAYVGACTGAKLDDLRMVALVLKGKKVSKNIDFFVAPATLNIRKEADKEGILKVLVEAGAKVLPSGCGGCIGLGPARLGENVVGISTTNRNFVGRAGHKSSELYLASPYTVAASAIAGKIADPRHFL